MRGVIAVAILHLVNRSPFREDALESCLRIARPGSALLLYEDGVYAGVRGTRVEERLVAAAGGRRVYVLEPDLAARGLGDAALVPGVERVDYAGFVELAIEYDSVATWR